MKLSSRPLNHPCATLHREREQLVGNLTRRPMEDLVSSKIFDMLHWVSPSIIGLNLWDFELG